MNAQNSKKRRIRLFVLCAVLIVYTRLSLYAVIGITGIQHAISYSEPGMPATFECIGRIDLTAEGNAAPFTFSWNTGAETEDLEGLCAGAYTVTVTNRFGCTKVLSATVLNCDGNSNEVTVAILSSKVVYTPASVQNNQAGIEITLAPIPGGTNNLYFKWTNEQGMVVATTQNLPTQMPPGRYCVEISGHCGPVLRNCFTISPCFYTMVLIETPSLPCPKLNNGAINLLVSSGVAPYGFLWSNGATTQNLSNVSSGVYFVKVTDAQGCFQSKKIELQAAITGITSTQITPACTGAVGSLTVQPQYLSNFNYTWSNGVTGSGTEHTLTGLTAGTYTVTVANPVSGCSLQQSFEVPGNIPQGAIGIHKVAGPNGFDPACNGALSVSVDPGVWSSGTNPPVYIAQWSGDNGYSATGNQIMNLCAGTYTVTVADAAGCSGVKSATLCRCGTGNEVYDCLNITQGQSLVIRFHRDLSLITQPGFANQYQGAIHPHFSGGGGEPHYSYTWKKTGDPNFIAYTKAINQLTPGVYCVTVTNGCSTTSECFEIFADDVPTIVKPSCINGNNGSITFQLDPQKMPFQIDWGTGSNLVQTTPFPVMALSPGTYNITLTDNNNFTRIITRTIREERSNEAYGWPFSVEGNHIGNTFFSVREGCMEDSNWWRAWHSPEIILKCPGSSFPINLSTPNTFSLGVDWPNDAYSTITFTPGNCEISGPSSFHCFEDVAQGYPVALFDENNCRLEFCMQTAWNGGATPSLPHIENVQIPGTGLFVNAYTGYGCRENACPVGDCDNPVFNSNSGFTGFQDFEFIPQVAGSCYGGGVVNITCSEPQLSFVIPVSAQIDEFIDYSQSFPVGDDGRCYYKGACIVTIPEGVSLALFPENLPIYLPIQTPAEVNCPPTTDPGNPGDISCEGDYIIQITDTDNCVGTVYCYSLDGLTILTQVSLLYEKVCKTIESDEEVCYQTLYCERTGDDLFLERIQVPCPTSGDIPNCPDIARPGNDSIPPVKGRSEEEQATVSMDGVLFNIFPVPSFEYAYLNSVSSQEGIATVTIFTIDGRKIMDVNWNLDRGENLMKLELTGAFRPGLYWVECLFPDGVRERRKLVKI